MGVVNVEDPKILPGRGVKDGGTNVALTVSCVDLLGLCLSRVHSEW